MSRTQHSTAAARTPAQAQAPGARSNPANVYSQIIDLARRSTSRARYFGDALRLIAEACGSPYAACYVRLGSEVLQDHCHGGPTDPNFWKQRVERLLTDALNEHETRAVLLSARSADLRVAVAAVPLSNPAAGVLGAVSLVLPLYDDEPRARVAFLESVCALAAHAAAQLGPPSGAGGGQGAAQSGAAVGRAAAFETVEALAFNLTNNLRNKLGCEQVALGLVRGAHVRILSISGLDDVKSNSPGVLQLRAAMEECLDAGEVLAAGGERSAGADAPARYRLHEAWRDAAGPVSVASVPLRSGDDVVAILSLRRRGEQPFSAEQLEQVRGGVEPYAPALLLVQRASRGLIRHAVDRVTTIGRWLLAPGKHGRKLCAAVIAAAALWFCFGTMRHEITVPSTLSPVSVRHVSAPFAGVLVAAPRVAGDSVRAGDVLCVMDTRALELQRAELTAELAVAGQQRAMALAEDKPVEAQLAAVNAGLVEARLAALEDRLSRAVVRSPFDGVVVSGDLRPRVGSMVAQGDALFQIAPLSGWNVELSVPESAARGLSAGVAGVFANVARPEDTRPLKITRVRPSAEIRDGRNCYVAEAQAELEAGWLRPGMQGVSRLNLGPRPVWWIALHHVIDSLRLNFWL
ncbi:MAG: HlyD family efflux transporter periplasmic adaptor subunit [Planctomycetia bacterium]|nr:MAG: HlyD family efflux transporter periplasmic adaptor subunit [Planctomycetia bacterium]